MPASRFRSLSEENIAQLLNDKGGGNTKKSTKQHRLIFESYLEEKNIKNFYESFAPGREKRMLKLKLIFSFKSLKIL